IPDADPLSATHNVAFTRAQDAGFLVDGYLDLSLEHQPDLSILGLVRNKTRVGSWHYSCAGQLHAEIVKRPVELPIANESDLDFDHFVRCKEGGLVSRGAGGKKFRKRRA